MQTVKDLASSGMGLLVVEQNLGVATALAERQLVMATGSIATETTAAGADGRPGRPAPLPRRRAAPGRRMTEPRFTFGLWTVGNPGRDPFGEPTRAPLDPVDSVHKLAELGAWGVSLHDNDLVPWGTPAAEGERIVSRFRAALARPGWASAWARRTCSAIPAFKDGAFTSNDRGVRRAAIGKAMRAIDLSARLGAEVFVFWGGREGTEVGSAKDPRDALERYREAVNVLSRVRRGAGLRPAVRDRAEAQRAARRHLPAHRRARAALHHHARPSRARRRQPRGRPRDDGGAVVPARGRAGAVGGQALPHRPQRAADRPLRPGLPLRRRGPQGVLPAGAAARARRLRRAAALRRPRLPQRGRGRGVGLRRRLHAHLPRVGRARRALRRTPEVKEALAAASAPSWRRVGGGGARPTRSRPRPRSSTSSRCAATPTSGSTSSSSRSCSACTDRGRDQRLGRPLAAYSAASPRTIRSSSVSPSPELDHANADAGGVVIAGQVVLDLGEATARVVGIGARRARR